jgi:hypothetical protein
VTREFTGWRRRWEEVVGEGERKAGGEFGSEAA